MRSLSAELSELFSQNIKDKIDYTAENQIIESEIYVKGRLYYIELSVEVETETVTSLDSLTEPETFTDIHVDVIEFFVFDDLGLLAPHNIDVNDLNNQINKLI